MTTTIEELMRNAADARRTAQNALRVAVHEARAADWSWDRISAAPGWPVLDALLRTPVLLIIPSAVDPPAREAGLAPRVKVAPYWTNDAWGLVCPACAKRVAAVMRALTERFEGTVRNLRAYRENLYQITLRMTSPVMPVFRGHLDMKF